MVVIFSSNRVYGIRDFNLFVIQQIEIPLGSHSICSMRSSRGVIAGMWRVSQCSHHRVTVRFDACPGQDLRKLQATAALPQQAASSSLRAARRLTGQGQRRPPPPSSASGSGKGAAAGGPAGLGLRPPLQARAAAAGERRSAGPGTGLPRCPGGLERSAGPRRQESRGGRRTSPPRRGYAPLSAAATLCRQGAAASRPRGSQRRSTAGRERRCLPHLLLPHHVFLIFSLIQIRIAPSSTAITLLLLEFLKLQKA